MMWKPDVQGRGKIQRAFRNGESHNLASETKLFLSRMGPGERQGAMGSRVGVCDKAHLRSPHGMGLCSGTGGKGDELGLADGPHFPCTQPCPSTITLLMLMSLSPGTSRGTASVAAALESILPPADVAAVTDCGTGEQGASSPCCSLSWGTTTHEQAMGHCSNMLGLKSCEVSLLKPT